MKNLRVPHAPKWLNAQNIVVACAVLALTAVLSALFFVQQGRIASQDDRITSQESRIQTLTGQNGYLTEQYTRVYGQAKTGGVEPTTAPPSTLPDAATPGAAGASGKDGRGVAFSICTALGWVVTYTDGKTENAGLCEGDRGKSGPPGKAGATGAPGATGDRGADSTIPGPPGSSGSPGADSSVPGPSGAQGPQGPAGPAGADGKDGAAGTPGTNGTDGRGVTSISCVEGPAFRFAFTDGTTQDIPGACDAPSPTTDPTPAG